MMIAYLLGLAASTALNAVEEPIAPPIVRAPPAIGHLPPEPEGPPPTTRASANLPALFSRDDYPHAALRAGEQGFVGFTLAIGPDGRVTGCRIDKSSASVSLDHATCSILSRRARFTPARDSAGNAVEDRVQGRIRWVLPPRPPIPYADHTSTLVFSIDATGAIAGCRSEDHIAAAQAERYCTSMRRQAERALGGLTSAKNLVGRELVFEMGVRVGGPERLEEIGRGPRDTRLAMFAIAVDIDPAGTIVECGAAGANMDGRRVATVCAESRNAKVVPLDNDSAARQPVRRAVRYWANYARSVD